TQTPLRTHLAAPSLLTRPRKPADLHPLVALHAFLRAPRRSTAHESGPGKFLLARSACRRCALASMRGSNPRSPGAPGGRAAPPRPSSESRPPGPSVVPGFEGPPLSTTLGLSGLAFS